MTCQHSPVSTNAIDQRVRTAAERALRTAGGNLAEDTDAVEQIEQHVRAAAATRRSTRPANDTVLHVCLAAIAIHLKTGYPSQCMFAPCPDPQSCSLPNTIKILLSELPHSTRAFVLGIAATRISIFPVQ